MRIIADENIPQIAEALRGVGAVRLLHGRKITREEVQDADALLVRSITPVNAALLEGTAIRFVGTATAGTDHLDIPWLDAQGITHVSAAGSNARSVFEYVAAALLELCAEAPLEGRTLGIVGHGRIGSLVEGLAPVFGMKVLLCDPPKARALGAVVPYLPLEEVLRNSDVLTFHVPRIADGKDRTAGMIGEAELSRMKRGAVLLNTSRGDVIGGAPLLAALRDGHLAAAVLDVWEDEPRVDPGLLARVQIATPHVAGYSTDGKLAGTLMVADALRAFLGMATGDWSPRLPAPIEPALTVAPDMEALDALRWIVRAAWDIREDDARTRDALKKDTTGAAFDALRKNYPVRREFAAFTAESEDRSVRELAARLGFRLSG